MTTNNTLLKKVSVLKEDSGKYIHNDLATVSCYASTELSKIVQGQEYSCDAIKQLVGRIKHSLIGGVPSGSSHPSVDPMFSTVMDMAFEASFPSMVPQLTTLNQLIQESQKVVVQLDQIAQHPQAAREHRMSELNTLRRFCLSISKCALAYEESLDAYDSDEFWES